MYSGYFKQPELTAESTDEEGFFHTGALARQCGLRPEIVRDELACLTCVVQQK
jgi:acyl-CoA synthetase (AMP-forming)/AMP-acid ligase II